MRAVIKDEKLKLNKGVTSGVPQNLVLALMFSVYVNDMPEGLSSYISLFAEYTTVLRKI